MLPETLTLDGLTADVPRAARFTARVQATRLLLLLASVSVVGLFLSWAIDDLRDLSALGAHGQRTTAQIIGKHMEGGGRSTAGYSDYTFSANGVQVEGKEHVDKFDHDHSPSSGTLPMTFLPSDPRIQRTGPMTSDSIQGEWAVWIFRVFGACVFWGLVLFFREAALRRSLKLLRDGALAAGTVTYCDKAPREGFFIMYEFTVDGWLFPKTITGLQRFRERVEVGSTMAILYDPARASRNVPYRMMTDVALARPRQ